ncbi:MAG: GH25 family lysozyme [Flavobacteriales bacterium]|nr:GH25 family lysozyme [Flavobacteriales bacterium]
MKATIRFILYLFFSSMVLGLAAIIGYWYYTHQPAKRYKKNKGKYESHVPPSTYNKYSIPSGFENYPLGMDVSHYQGKIDWQQVKKDGKIQFVFIKATEGKSITDSLYWKNYFNCKNYNIPCGAYHYFIPGVDGAKQAHHFLSNCKIEKGDLRPVLDIEVMHWEGATALHREIDRFMQVVKQKTGQEIILYTGNNFYKKYLKAYYPNHTIWLAHYNIPNIHHRTNKWHIWQYTETGKVKGVPGFVDLNLFNGTLSDLEKLKVK